MEMLKRILRLLRPYKARIVLMLSMQLVVIVSRLINPILTKSVVNDVITAGNVSLLPTLCVEIFLLVLARALCNYRRGLISERISQNVAFDLRTGLYRHMQELPYEFYDKNRVGEIMSRMTGDLDGVRNLIAVGILQVFDNGLGFIGALFFMSFMSWKMMLMLLVFLPLIAAVAWRFNSKVRPAFREIREQNAVLNTRVQENLAGVHVVKAFAQEDYEQSRFDGENQKLLSLHVKATYIWSNFVPLMDLLSGLCTPVALIGGAALMALGEMDVGTLVGVTGYIWILTNPMRQLSGIINMVAQAVTSAEKLFY